MPPRETLRDRSRTSTQAGLTAARGIGILTQNAGGFTVVHIFEKGRTLDWITREIAIGNCDDALRLDALCSAGIASILSLTGWPNSAANRHGINWRCVELIDGHGNEVGRLHEAIRQLHALLAHGAVLVHCMEGISRSPLVVASYLADATDRPFDDCLRDVALLRKGAILQPGLLELRRAYETAIEPRRRLVPRSSAEHSALGPREG